MEEKFDLTDIVLIGRTFEEYNQMFMLHDEELKNEKILDVASGVSSFCKEASKKGFNVTASDRIYDFSADEILAKCKTDLEIIIDKFPNVSNQYNWDLFEDIEGLKRFRERAYTIFGDDFQSNPQRYIHTHYPNTTFNDDEFTLTLVSHFLFLYDEFLDYDFHKQVILELARITSSEIRIYPFFNLKWKRSPFVDRLITDKDLNHLAFSIQKIDYEFMKDCDEMLTIKKRLKS